MFTSTVFSIGPSLLKDLFMFLPHSITYVLYLSFCPIDFLYGFILWYTLDYSLDSLFTSVLFSFRPYHNIQSLFCSFSFYLFLFLNTLFLQNIQSLFLFLVAEALMVKRGAVDRWLADTPSPITTTTTITILLSLSFPNMYCSEPRWSLFDDIWRQRGFNREITRK